jgi:plastocyanin domain-containing protein
MDRIRHMATRTPDPSDFVHKDAPSSVVDQIGPRQAGTVYDNASGIFEVLQVVTDPSEARRILRRNAAQFAIEVVDLHAGTAHYTGAVWTGSDRVLKAVA